MCVMTNIIIRLDGNAFHASLRDRRFDAEANR
jgi:hypothetical protein